MKQPWVLGVVGVAVCQLVAVVAASSFDGDGTQRLSVWVLAAATIVGGSILALGHVRGWWKSLSVTSFLFVAVLLRLVALPLGPTLSDDAYRYMWDGRLTVEMENPYLHTPEALPDSLTVIVDPGGSLYNELNSPLYYSVYPPPSQYAFAIGTLLGRKGHYCSFVIYKLLIIILEVLSLIWLVNVIPVAFVVLLAWHPLLVLEVAGQGHTEGLWVVGCVAGFAGLIQGRSNLGIACITVGAWAKMIPLLLVPLLVLRKGWSAAVVGLAVTLALWAPFFSLEAMANIGASLRLYVQLFEFNGGPYFLIKHTWLALTGVDVSKTLGPLLSGGFFAFALTLYLFELRRRTPPRSQVLSTELLLLGGYLLVTTTVHPWYVLMPIALCPFVWVAGSRAMRRWMWGWWWFGLFAVGTYGFYVGEMSLAVISGVSGWMAVLIATVAAFAISSPVQKTLGRVMQRRGRSKWRWIKQVKRAGSPTSILDLGAGEGWVGWAAQVDTGAAVHLADVVDLNQTMLPHVKYDGASLPFVSGQFDMVLLVFVLHHAEAPDAVLREARRVVDEHGCVAVVESVYTNAFNHGLLRFLDVQANRLRGEGEMEAQEAYLSFDTVEGWRSRFEHAGFRIDAESSRGRWIHRQHLFVLGPAVS